MQPVSSRTWLAEYMKGKGFDKMVTDWVGTNLVEVPGTQPGVGPYEWAFDVENCEAMYTSYANSWWVCGSPWSHPRPVLLPAPPAPDTAAALSRSCSWRSELSARLLGTVEGEAIRLFARRWHMMRGHVALVPNFSLTMPLV